MKTVTVEAVVERRYTIQFEMEVVDEVAANKKLLDEEVKDSLADTIRHDTHYVTEAYWTDKTTELEVKVEDAPEP